MNWIITHNWRKKVGQPVAKNLLIVLTLSFTFYGVVRATGWVIGGFVS